MRLPRILKRKIEKGRTTKDAKMGHGTRVDMWGNDLWSISIMGKKNKIPEQNKSNKLVFVFF